MTEHTPFSLLYRIENPNLPAEPNGITSHEALVGQWFASNLDTALVYLPKSTQTYGRGAAPVAGAQLVVARVPHDKLPEFHVYEHAIAREMDIENDNYIIPRDGSVPMTTLPLDDVLGDLRGRLGRFPELQEANRRIAAHVIAEMIAREDGQ